MTGTVPRWLAILRGDMRREPSGMLPGPHLLKSAARVLTIVGLETHSDTDIRASYRSTVSGGLLSSDGLRKAERWLADHGWLTRDGEVLIPSDRCRALPNDEEDVARELVRTTILDVTPTWLGVVVARGEVRAELLPEQVAAVLMDTFDAEERDAILRAAAAKYDDAALRAIGDAGEEAVVIASQAFLEAEGRPDLAGRVRRVSLISDALGYDVTTPDLAGRECRIEVKCYRGRYPRFYITRNEFEVGLRLPGWYLVLCRFVPDSAPRIVGWMTLAPLIGKVPVETDGSVTWQLVRVRLRESDLRPGLPMSLTR